METFEIYTGDDKKDKRYPFFCFFTDQCKETFSFLLTKYNFKLDRTEMMGALFIESIFRSSDSGISISFDPREGLKVFLVKLSNNSVGLYDPKTHFSIKKCLRLKSIQKELYDASWSELKKKINKEDIIKALEEHAMAIEEHCQDFLSGDFSSLE